MKLSDTHSTGIAILSKRAPKTLALSLASYERVKLKDMFTEHCIIFQAITPKDLAVADKYEYRCAATGYNSDICDGIRQMLESIESDYILLMENDCPLLANLSEQEIYYRLQESLDIIVQEKADLVRLRNAWRPGGHVNAAKRYSRYYDIEELAAKWQNAECLDHSPSWLKYLRRSIFRQEARSCIGRSVYVEQNPHLRFPSYIQKEGTHYIADSEVFTWTNQPTLLSRHFLQRTIKELEKTFFSFIDINEEEFERRINSRHWRQHHHKIAISPGIFTHQEE